MTTNARHTPGSWAWRESVADLGLFGDGGRRVMSIASGVIPMANDARLIASAPDLLAALGGLLTGFGFGDPSLSELDLEDGEREAIDAARAAIAKARGEGVRS